MKAKKIILSIAMLIAILSSCEKVEFGNDFLEKEPSVDVTKDTIFGSTQLAMRYLTKGYSTLPYGLNLDWGAKDNKLGMDILESLTDLNHSVLSWGGVNQLYYNGQYTAATENTSTNTKYHYIKESSWEGIRIGWNFIENVNKDGAIPDASPEVKKRLIGEAKMIIAVHYTDMFRHFGGLPWIDHALSPAEEAKFPRKTALETMNNIVKLCDEASEALPWVLPDVTNEDGRFTKASALALKARVLLFGASPLFNSGTAELVGPASDQKLTHHGSYNKEMWKDAADAAKVVLDGVNNLGGYKLVNTGNPRKDFQDAYYKRGNGEILISTRARFKSGGYWATNYYFYQSAGGYGTACPTKEYVDMFPMASGKSILDTDSGYDPKNPWANRDPRLYETVLVNDDDFDGRKAELWIGGRERLTAAGNGARSGFALRKFLLDRNTATSIQSIVQWPYLRLAEIYLSYAEALNEYNDGPTEEAYDAIDEVRKRVGLGELKRGLDEVAFRKAVLTERALEFGFEEVRWFDIVRHDLKDDFKKTLHGVNTTRNPDGSYSYETVALPTRHWQGKDDKSNRKWYLSAFPPNEVLKGNVLVQNPGW